MTIVEWLTLMACVSSFAIAIGVSFVITVMACFCIISAIADWLEKQ